MTALAVQGLEAKLGEVSILKGIDLEVPYGEIHALMGPNGSGKSTLCHVLMGKADYEARGAAQVDGTELLGLPVDQRARLGLFKTFQYPVEVPGVSLVDLVDEMAIAAEDEPAFRSRARDAAERLGMSPFLERPINLGLSGGEKKRSEIFQLASSHPKMVILDEIDSGLDIDAVREVADLVESLRSPDLGVLIITHYSRILKYMSPDRIHIMLDGRIVRSGGAELADELESTGYDELRRQLGLVPEPGDDPLAGL